MKTILNITFIIIITLISCAKPEEIILEKDTNSSSDEADYFPINVTSSNYLESQNYEDDIAYFVDTDDDYTSFNKISDFVMDKSYVYGSLGGSYDSYYETVSVKKDGENISFLIEEKHEDVYPSYSSSFWYTVEKTPYELELLKPNMSLNQTWTSTQSMTTTYDGYYSYYPTIQPDVYNVTFNYEVTEKNAERYINNILYVNLITISVTYYFDQVSSFTRMYTFSDGVGLVEFRLQNKTYLKED